MKPIKNKKIMIVVSIIFLCLTSFIFYINLAEQKNSEQNLPVIKLKADDCVIQKIICHLETDEFELDISSDQNIYYLKPFNISALIKVKNDFIIKKIQLEFKMIAMKMGVNRFLLNTNDMTEKEQNWTGKALLPVCVTGRADWVMALEVLTNKARYVLRMPITVKRITS